MEERLIGTVSRGVRAPIIREGDDIAAIVAESVVAAGKSENIAFRDRDIVAVTEAVVARAQGNYATVDQIAEDIKNKFPEGTFGVIFPILSRNRFAICLKGIARGAKKIVLILPMRLATILLILIRSMLQALILGPTFSPKQNIVSFSE